MADTCGRSSERSPAGTSTFDNASESLFQLEKEARYRLENYSDSNSQWFDQHVELLVGNGIEICPQLTVEVLLLFVQWYLKDGRLDTARHLATAAACICRQAKLSALLRRSLNLLGAAHSREGEPSEAAVYLVEALQIADQIGDRLGRMAVIANLATLRYNVGLLAETVALNRYVIELTGGDATMRTIAADAHHNIAMACLLLDDITTAFQEIKRSVDLKVDVGNQWSQDQRAICELTYVRILVKLNRLEDARQRAALVEEIAERTNSRLSRMEASLASILCEAAGGSPMTALTRLDELKGVLDGSGPTYRDLLEIEWQCHILSGQHGSAERCRELYVRELAAAQRRAAIQQVAAIQRSINTFGTATEPELLALPRTARDRLLGSWSISKKSDLLREQLEAIASLADQREDWSGEHSVRVGRLVHRLAKELGYEEEQASALDIAARLHDIGKVATPDVLLLKRGKLLPQEQDILRRHTVEGCQILTDILCTLERHKAFASSDQVEILRMGAEIAQDHHEWWDGTGYPRGLSGTSIPDAARMTALADVFDELTNARPYKEACGVDEALQQINQLSGRQFEPRLCEAFVSLVRQLQQEHGRELEGFVPREEELSAYRVANRVIERIVEQAGGRLASESPRQSNPEPLAV